ncbi:MAG: hypothetical protein R2755_21080 [Acidimicrobiales bacterium]
MHAPPENCARPAIMMEEANWVQNMEGDLDSVHLDWIHKRLSKDAPPPPVGIAGFTTPIPTRPPRRGAHRLRRFYSGSPSG